MPVWCPRSRLGLSWALPLIAASLLGSPAGAVTKVVFTGTVNSDSDDLLSTPTPSGAAYVDGQQFQLTFEVNGDFSPANPAWNSVCYSTTFNRYQNTNAACPLSPVKDVAFTGMNSNTTYNQSLGSAIIVPQRSFTSNLGFSRGASFGDTGRSLNSSGAAFTLVGWTVPASYTFATQPTPYMVYPYTGGPASSLLSPSALISWYYNNSYYRNYALSSPNTITLNFNNPDTGDIPLSAYITQMDIISEAPAPLPLFGAISGFAYSRRLRRRCRAESRTRSSSPCHASAKI